MHQELLSQNDGVTFLVVAWPDVRQAILQYVQLISPVVLQDGEQPAVNQAYLVYFAKAA
jgi:hypothetical protein